LGKTLRARNRWPRIKVVGFSLIADRKKLWRSPVSERPSLNPLGLGVMLEYGRTLLRIALNVNSTMFYSGYAKSFAITNFQKETTQ
jgi:hypothetical protein